MLALALRRKIAAQRGAFEAIGQEDAPKVWVAFEADAEEIKNLALEPVGAGPNRSERVDDGLLGTEASAESQAIAAVEGNELVVHLKARLDGEAVNTGDITEEIEFQGRIVATLLSQGAEEVFGNDQGGFAAIFDNFRDRLGVPSAEVLDNSISVCIGKLRHVTEILREPSRRYFRDLCQSSAPFFQR